MRLFVKSAGIAVTVGLLVLSGSPRSAQANVRLDIGRSAASTVTVPCVKEGAVTYCLPNAADPECTLVLHYSFQGEIVNGVISGTWEYDASTKCTLRMKTLSAQASLSPGTTSTPAGCSGTLTGGVPCNHAYSEAGYSCTGCSYGPYSETGGYVLTFLYPVAEVAYDPTVCKPSGLYTLLCALHINGIMLA